MITQGWDTVFVISADRVNEMLIANADKTVLQFGTSLPNMPAWTATGRFAPWQLAEGGSNDIVHLRLPIETGTLSDGTTSFDLAGLTLVIATYLDWLAFNDQQQLQFDYHAQGEPGNEPDRGELSVIALRDPNQQLPPEFNALLAYAFGAFLVANRDQVRFVFATVNLIPPTVNSWLAPKKSAYGYFRRESSDQHFLAILSVTTDRDISKLQRTVDPTALPTTTNASFVIADNLYLLNVIAPSLAHAFNTGADAFYYDGTNRVLRNNRRLWTRPVKSGAITYHPFIDYLEIRSVDGALQGRYSGGVDLYAGISMTYTIDARNAASYDTSSGTLGFARDPSPKESHQADIPWYWWLGGLIVIAVVEIVVSVISNDIADQITNDNRERLAFGRYPPSSILWGSSSGLFVNYVGINNAMYILGNV